MKNLILVLLTYFMFSCTSNDNDEIKNDQSLYEKNILKDYELFKSSDEYISSNQLDLALIE